MGDYSCHTVSFMINAFEKSENFPFKIDLKTSLGVSSKKGNSRCMMSSIHLLELMIVFKVPSIIINTLHPSFEHVKHCL